MPADYQSSRDESARLRARKATTPAGKSAATKRSSPSAKAAAAGAGSAAARKAPGRTKPAEKPATHKPAAKAGPRPAVLSLVPAYPGDEPQPAAAPAPPKAASGRPRALVTGATSGIGLALAHVLGREGYDLVLVARGLETLEQVAVDLAALYGAAVETVAVDLSSSEGPATVAQRVLEGGDRLEVLVNNAGIGVYGAFAETSLDAELDMIALNIASVTALTKLLLPAVQGSGKGRILNVASTAAFQPGPFMAAYYASKAYVLHFSEALAAELHGSGVSVTALCPGVVPTGFQVRAGVDGIPLVKVPGALAPDKVAQQAYRGMMRGRRVVVPGAANKVGVQMVRVAPRRLTTALVRRLQSH